MNRKLLSKGSRHDKRRDAYCFRQRGIGDFILALGACVVILISSGVGQPAFGDQNDNFRRQQMEQQRRAQQEQQRRAAMLEQQRRDQQAREKAAQQKAQHEADERIRKDRDLRLQKADRERLEKKMEEERRQRAEKQKEQRRQEELRKEREKQRKEREENQKNIIQRRIEKQRAEEKKQKEILYKKLASSPLPHYVRSSKDLLQNLERNRAKKAAEEKRRSDHLARVAKDARNRIEKLRERKANAHDPRWRTVKRAMSEAELKATLETGLARGGRPGIFFATPYNKTKKSTFLDKLNTGKQVQQKLALPVKPQVVVTMKVCDGRRFKYGRRVQPKYGQPGGGYEIRGWGIKYAKVLDVRKLTFKKRTINNCEIAAFYRSSDVLRRKEERLVCAA